jgi:hypothetical protein
MDNSKDNKLAHIVIPIKDLENLKIILLETLLNTKNDFLNLENEEEKRYLLGKEYFIVETLLNFSKYKKLEDENKLRFYLNSNSEEELEEENLEINKNDYET